MDQQYQNRAKISGPTPYKMSVAAHFLNKKFHNNLFFLYFFFSKVMIHRQVQCLLFKNAISS